MKDRVLSLAICISVGVHLILLGVIERTSAAKPIEVENLKLVQVDLAKEAEKVSVEEDKPDEPKPEPEAETPKFTPPPVYVPPVQSMKTEAPVRKVPVQKAPVPVKARSAAASRVPQPVKMARLQPAGDPGGELNLGSSSDQGTINVSQGNTSVGFVPSTTPGRGEGSGTGAGKAIHQDPVRNAAPGPGTVPAPEPAYIPPAPPPAPRKINVRLCSVSGLRPNEHCSKTETKEFIEGAAPTGTCRRCKAPEPEHISKLAESKPAELIRDVDVRIPGIVKEAGVKAVVKVEYTIKPDGSVTDLEVTKSSGNPLLDKAVVEAWSKLKYTPAIQDGVPRSVKKRRTFTYNP